MSYSQTIVISENFRNGIPQEWEVTTSNPKRSWKAKKYKSNYYISMSAFNGRDKQPLLVKSSFFSPILKDSLNRCKLKFSFADAYSNGQPLSIYITDSEKNIVKKINSEYFEKYVNNNHRYDNNFEASPWIPLPELNIPYRIEFRYTSQGKISTTIQLNEVDVWCR